MFHPFQLYTETIEAEGKKVHPNNPHFSSFPEWKRQEDSIVTRVSKNILFVYLVPLKGHFLLCLLYMALVLIFFSLSFLRTFYGTRSEYLSPFDGQNVLPNCEVVPAKISGTFRATWDGYWEGGADYKESKAIYALTVSSFATSPQNYANIFDATFFRISEEANKSVHRDLADNLVVWMTLSLNADATGSNRFYLIGSPMQIFDRQFHRTTLGNENLTCTSIVKTIFDRNTARLTAMLPSRTFSNRTDSCAQILQIDRLGFEFALKKETLEQTRDLRSLVMAMAVNAGLTRIQRLSRIPVLDKNITVGGYGGTNRNETYTISKYYDAKYPGMTPISCILNDTRPLCFMEINDFPALPFFYHLGERTDYPARCNCTKLVKNKAIKDADHPCHAFRFLSGYFYWNDRDYRPLLEMFKRYKLSDFYDKGFTAAFLSSSFGVASNHTSMNNTSFRQSSFDFCQSKQFGPCSVLVTSSYDLYPGGRTISSNYYQLTRGACTDNIQPRISALNQMKAKTFMPLFQGYQICQKEIRTRLLESAGIAMGNLQLLAPFLGIFVLLVALLYKYVVRFKRRSDLLLDDLCEKFYSRTERRMALDALASTLSVHSDAIHWEEEDLLDGSTLHLLADDLIRQDQSPAKQQVIDFLQSRTAGDECPSSSAASPSPTTEDGGSSSCPPLQSSPTDDEYVSPPSMDDIKHLILGGVSPEFIFCAERDDVMSDFYTPSLSDRTHSN